jgi:hypothetical protein
MSSTTWRFGYEDEDGVEAEVSVCDYGTVHLHMEHVSLPNWNEFADAGDVPPVSASLTQVQAREMALELLRRAYTLDDDDVEHLDAQIGFVTGKPVRALTREEFLGVGLDLSDKERDEFMNFLGKGTPSSDATWSKVGDAE